MKKAVMKKWVAALRSGKYKRGSGWLRKRLNGQDRFCCLGVLCDISKKAKWVDGGGEHYFASAQASDHGDEHDKTLPLTIREWSGLMWDDGGFIGDDGRCKSLAKINDSGKYSFAKIADIIEKNREKL